MILGSPAYIGLIMARRLTLRGARVQAVDEDSPENPAACSGTSTSVQEDFDIPLIAASYGGGYQRQGAGQRRDRVRRGRRTGQAHSGHPVRNNDCDTLLNSLVGLIPGK